MKTLEDAYELRNKKINKIELLKQEQKALDFWNDFENICKNPYENLSEVHEKHLLKCFGIYDKGDANSFTIRIRIPFGQLTPTQAKKFAQTSKTYGKSCVDLTTRGQIEFRNLKLHELPTVLRELESVGITTFQTAGDNFRGVITSPLDGYSKTSLISCETLFNDIQDVFLKNEEYIGTLPRKFNTGILGDTINDCNIYGHDCAFVLASKDEELGFNLYLGGKVGVQARPINLFVKPEDVKVIFKTIVDLFKKYGFRDNRNKNRMAYFLDEISTQEFEKAIIKASNLDLKSAGILLVKNEYKIDETSTIKLKNNKTAIYFSIPAGIFSAEDLDELSDLMQNSDSVLRLTHEQSFFIITNDENIDLIKNSNIYKKYDSFHNIYFNNQIACAGTNECSFGVIANKSDAIEMALYLNSHIPISDAKIRMYWSACPKGCGVHGVADIGFEGAKAKDENGNSCDGVKIFIGGKATNSILEARQLSKAIPISKAQEVVKELLHIYKTQKLENESFENFDSRVLSSLPIEEIQKELDYKMQMNNQTPLESFIEHKVQTGMQCGNYSIDIAKPKAGEQYRFHFDATACIGCHCCEVACNEQNNNSADVKWRRVAETQSGIFPNVKNHFNSMSCNHCLEPECLKGCPTESYIKLDNGIVFHDDDSCIGCQYCTWNCPYEVPVFNKDRGIVTKCHMCHEKLAVGQTPACVQACPSGAIAIEIVNVNEWLNEGLKKEGIAPNLPDIEITKPTTRYTIDETADMTPADEHIVKPNHSEWPLVFMTVLTQISLGGFATAFLGESANLFGFNLPTPNFVMMAIIFLLSAIALPLSALHLGKPLKAMTAMKNIKTSWLSREALWLGVYTLGTFLVALLYFFEFSQTVKFLLEIATLGSGIYGIYAQSMIYRIKARPSWNKQETTNIFFNVGYIGVLLVGAILVASKDYQSAFIVVPFGAFIGFLQYTIFKNEVEFYTNLEESEKNFYQLNKTKKLYENNFIKLRDYRRKTLVLGAFVLPIFSMLLLASQSFTLSLTALIIAVIVSFSSEIISRLLFYKTAVSLGIAGNFFMGNQRG